MNIAYSVVTGNNTPALLGGNNPDSGSIFVEVELASLNGAFSLVGPFSLLVATLCVLAALRPNPPPDD